MKFQPVEYKVLVIPDKVDEYEGIIFIPDTVREKHQIAQDKATIVAIGGNAFEEWNGTIPKIGDKVLLNRHAGYRFFDKADNNREYRVVNDKDITMILSDEAEVKDGN